MKFQLDEKLAELTGIIIGDGCLFRKQNLIMISGNPIKDRKYYEFVGKIINQYARKRPKFKIHQRALRLIIRDKNFFDFFFNYLGMRYDGNKTYKVSIPQKIIENFNFTKYCLRGLVDTDGSVFKSDKPGSPNYPSIEITTVSRNLSFQLKEVLKKFKYRVTLRWYDPKNKVQVRTYKIGLNGWLMLRKWYNDIGFSHPLKKSLAREIIKEKYGGMGGI